MGRKRNAATAAAGETTAMEGSNNGSSEGSSSATSSAVAEMSPSGYFRKLFTQKPKLLKDRKNDRIYDHWLKDHPGHDAVPAPIKGVLNNIKSQIRKEKGITTGNKAREEPAEQSPPTPARLSRAMARDLEQLEEVLDDCVQIALRSGKEELKSVLVLLRQARREVSLKLGVGGMA